MVVYNVQDKIADRMIFSTVNTLYRLQLSV